MFKLTDRQGNVILMKNGQPFVYMTNALARLGKKYLEPLLEVQLRVVSA